MSASLQVGGPVHGGHGWAFYTEGTAITQGTAQPITAATRTQILCDGLGSASYDGQIQNMAQPWTNDKVTPELNCFYNIRLTFKGQIVSGGAGHYLTVELDINGGIGVTWSGIDLFAKGADTEHSFQYSIPIFARSTFVANGGEFHVTPDVDMDLWDMRVLVNRTYIPN